MAQLHVIEKGTHPENLNRVDRELGEWESGKWYMKPEVAQRFVGGMIYLHKAQDQRSHFGGQILSLRMVVGDNNKERAVFRFRAMKEATDVRAGLDGWSQEMKFVW